MVEKTQIWFDDNSNNYVSHRNNSGKTHLELNRWSTTLWYIDIICDCTIFEFGGGAGRSLKYHNLCVKLDPVRLVLVAHHQNQTEEWDWWYESNCENTSDHCCLLNQDANIGLYRQYLQVRNLFKRLQQHSFFNPQWCQRLSKHTQVRFSSIV